MGTKGFCFIFSTNLFPVAGGGGSHGRSSSFTALMAFMSSSVGTGGGTTSLAIPDLSQAARSVAVDLLVAVGTLLY